MINHISLVSPDALSRRSAGLEMASISEPGTPDSSSETNTPTRRSVVPSHDGAGRPHRQSAPSAISVGNFLYLAPVGLVAAAIIAIFFGTGFLLLAPPVGGALSGSATRNFGPEVQSLSYGLPPLSAGDHQPANGKPRPVAEKPPSPSLGDQTPSSIIPLLPNEAGGDDLPPQQKTATVQSSIELPAFSPPPLVPAKANDIPARQEAEVGTSMGKTLQRAAPGSAAPPNPPPSSRAVPAPASPSTNLSAAEVTELRGHGDALLRSGDIASARLFYERAAAAGDGLAALRLGATFDPDFLASARLRNVQGDAAEARSWYSRALDLGAAEAKRQLNGLDTKQGR
jgi:hypothetical protein